MFTTDSVARPKVLGGMAWCQSPEEAEPAACAPRVPRRIMTMIRMPTMHRGLPGKVRRPHQERNLRNEKVRGSSPLSSTHPTFG
jgi:hypothetical protein